MRIVLITGISGSGKSVALHVLEDAGYFCVDNLPPTLLRNLVDALLEEGTTELAVAIDARSAASLSRIAADIRQLKEDKHDVKVFFLTATTEALVMRFSETRRSHPLSHRLPPNHHPADRLTLIECIHLEREMLSEVEGLGHVIDTSGLRASKLRSWIVELIDIDRPTLILLFESFAYKLGVPLDADLVFDVRMLANPYYDMQLRPLTGRDPAVIEFLEALPEARDLLSDIQTFIEKWLPAYKRDNRSYLTVAIGCTGGQHRSVYIVEQLATYFSVSENIVRRHRQLD